jgi:hypothetical protein
MAEAAKSIMCRWQACGEKDAVRDVELEWDGARLAVQLCRSHRLLASDRYGNGEQLCLVFSRFGVWVQNKERVL